MYEIPRVPEVSHRRFYRFYSRFHDFTFSRLLKCVGHDLERLQGRVVGGSYGLSSAVLCCDVSCFFSLCFPSLPHFKFQCGMCPFVGLVKCRSANGVVENQFVIIQLANKERETQRGRERERQTDRQTEIDRDSKGLFPLKLTA